MTEYSPALVNWIESNVSVALVVLFILGLMMIMFSSLANGTLQLMVADEFRGRLMAFYSMVFVGLSQALGSFMVGALAGAIGVAWAIGGTAVVTLVYTAAVMGQRPGLRRL